MIVGSTAQNCPVHGDLSVHVTIEVAHFNCTAHVKLCAKCLERKRNEEASNRNSDDW